MFVTRFVMSDTGKPGSLMYVLYQASAPRVNPVRTVAVKVDGVTVVTSPDGNADVGPFGSLWFPTPARGAHRLTVEATNACGSKEADSPLALRVK